MIQFFISFFRTIAIIAVILLGLNGLRLYATAANEQPSPQFTSNHSSELSIIKVSQLSSNPPTIPVLLLADPGLAYVLSAPSRQLQITIENADGICQGKLTTTDSSGVLTLPMAGTQGCASPRLVVFH